MRIIAFAILALLTACNRGPEAPTAAQNDQMNEADAVLDDMAANEAAKD